MFNKIKPNLKDFDYEESLYNCVNDLIQFSQVPCTRLSGNNRKDTKYMSKFNTKSYGRKILSWNLPPYLWYHGL